MMVVPVGLSVEVIPCSMYAGDFISHETLDFFLYIYTVYLTKNTGQAYAHSA